MQAKGSGEGGKKSRVNRKHVIIGVTCALVVAMVITGALFGVKFYLDSANELVMVSMQYESFPVTRSYSLVYVYVPVNQKKHQGNGPVKHHDKLIDGRRKSMTIDQHSPVNTGKAYVGITAVLCCFAYLRQIILCDA